MSTTYETVNQDDPTSARRTQHQRNDNPQRASLQKKPNSRTRPEDEVFELESMNPYQTSLSDEGPISNTWDPKDSEHSPSGPSRGVLLWWRESISAAIATVSLLAIVLALRLYQDQPLPDWPYNISINSLVSLFVVIMKGSVALILTSGLGQLKYDWFTGSAKPLSHLTAYDEASRGPLGALSLIFTRQPRQLLATLGALITLTATLIDPFTQQLIHVEACQRSNLKATAQLPRAHLFNEDQGPEHASPGMIAAINTGIFYPGQYSYPFTCPTGNCTLPASYYSVAFCSTCNNMHTEIEILTSPPEPYLFSEKGTSPYTYTVWTNTTLPSGLTAAWNAVNGSSLLFLSATNYTDKLTVEMILSKGASPPIGREYGEFENCSQTPQDTDWGCLGYGGSSCSVSPCIRVYSGNITAGNLTENTTASIDSWALTDVGSGTYLSMVNMQCLDDTAKTRVLDLTNANGTQRNNQWLPIPVAVDPNTGAVEADPTLTNAATVSGAIPKQCIYQITKNVSADVLSYLGQYMEGNVSVDGKTIVFGKSDGTDILQYFYNSGKIKFDNVQDYFNSMTLSMTNYVRQNGNASNNDPVIGTVWETMTCIHVRWPWILYPAVIVLVTWCFFIGLVISDQQQSSKNELLGAVAQRLPSHQHDSKSAIIPLLFHGFDEDSSIGLSDMGYSGRVADLQKDAKHIQAQLVMTNKGWKFMARGRVKGD